MLCCECDSFRGVPKLLWLADELCWLRRVETIPRDDVSPEYALSRVGCAVLSFVAQ